MPTQTTKLKLPRPIATDYFNLESQQALVDAIETNAVSQTEKLEITLDITEINQNITELTETVNTHKNENATKFTQIDQTLTNLYGDATKLKSSFKVVQNQTIPITGWSVVKDGVWRYDLSINGITTSDVVDVNIYLPSLEFASGLLSVTEALTNGVRVFCSEIPTTPLQCDVVIKKAVV